MTLCTNCNEREVLCKGLCQKCYVKNRYTTNKTRGLCRCGKSKDLGKKSCQSCRDYVNGISNSRTIKGLCRCGNEPVYGKKRCKKCLHYDYVRRASNRNAGKCACGNDRVSGKKSCQECLDFRINKSMLNKEKGLCQCGQDYPADGKDRCQVCLDRQNRIRQIHRESGLCQCGQDYPAEGKKLCKVCRDRGHALIISNKKNGLCWCGHTRFRGSSSCYMCIIRGNVRRYLTGKKSKHTEEIIGASFDVATTELDTRARLRYPDFDTNTTRPYHLDHIIPLSLVQELDPKDQDDAVNNLNCLANLQWLEGVENLKKQDSVPWKTNDPFWNATPENCCF